MSGLREQQEGFVRSIIGGVDKGYAQTIRDYGLSGTRRLGIYQNSVSFGLQDALNGVFDVVNKLVGSEYFNYVAKHYIQNHPSASGNVHDFGETFPEYLVTFPGLDVLPYLPDVARLEWAYHAAFHSPVGEMLCINKLAQVPESKYDRLFLSLSPTCHLLHSDFPVFHIWQVNQDDYIGDDVVNLEEGGVDLAIVREGKQIVFHSLMPDAFLMFKAIAEGKSFNESCELALEVEPECDVSQVLQDAVMNRIVDSFSLR